MPAFLITVVILLQLQIPCVYYNMDNREHVLFLKKMKNNDTCIEVGTKKL